MKEGLLGADSLAEDSAGRWAVGLLYVRPKSVW